MIKKIIILSSFLTLFIPQLVFGVMTSTNYSIIFDSVGLAGGDNLTSTSYSLSETIGETPVLTSSSTTYQIQGGYQASIFGSLGISLNTNSLNLGTLSDTAVNSATAIATVTSESAGYLLTVNSATGVMPAAVVGGTVTAGTEGYGFSASGPNSAIVGDVPVVGGTIIASTTAQVINDQNTLTFKAAASSTSVAGTYSQSVDLVVSPNY
ncbi:MAG: hypothetical protein WC725_03415 [Patescibacteria group bacterium]|jgi:hypothetical protein